MTELRSCPFCGSEIKVNTLMGRKAFFCFTCSAEIKFRRSNMPLDDQVKAWNTRAADEPTTSSSIVYESTTPHARLILEEE